MKKILAFCACIFVITPLLATLPTGYKMKSESFNVFVTAPPALVYVEDSQGNRTGADPSLPANSDGSQGSGTTGLSEIPLSFVFQDNSAQSSAATNTGWSIGIDDGGPQTYSVNLKGIADGVAHVTTSASFRHSTGTVKSNFDVLVLQGQTRKTNVTFDPGQRTLSVQRVVGNGDLLSDIKTACALDEINSPRICKHLEKKAHLIKKALDHHRIEEAENLVEEFLRSIGVHDSSRKHVEKSDDEDCHAYIKEPALTIITEDAKALLAQIEKEEKHHHENRHVIK